MKRRELSSQFRITLLTVASLSTACLWQEASAQTHRDAYQSDFQGLIKKLAMAGSVAELTELTGNGELVSRPGTDELLQAHRVAVESVEVKVAGVAAIGNLALVVASTEIRYKPETSFTAAEGYQGEPQIWVFRLENSGWQVESLPVPYNDDAFVSRLLLELSNSLGE